MKKTSTLLLPVAAPRNPFATAARQRAAGRHGGGAARARQQGQRALRAELATMHAPPRRPEA